MSDQIITVHGGAHADVKKALVQWLDLYAESLAPDFRFELYTQGRGQHLIRVDARVDNERFFYLVNYLCYPEGIHYRAVVEGFASWRDMEVIVFIPADERQTDNVYVMTTQKEAFKIDFGGKVTMVSVVRDFNPPDFDPSVLPPPEIIHPPLMAKKNETIFKEDRSDRRFKVILPIIVGLFLLSYLVAGNPARFLYVNGVIAVAVTFWLFVDYKLLRQLKYYILSVGVAVAIQFYGYWLALHYSSADRPVSFARATLMPFIFLALQYPCRYTFKIVMKREPVVDRPAPSVADFFYMAVLWMGVIGVFMWVS